VHAKNVVEMATGFGLLASFGGHFVDVRTSRERRSWAVDPVVAEFWVVDDIADRALCL
jgi:hypothetical protein